MALSRHVDNQQKSMTLGQRGARPTVTRVSVGLSVCLLVIAMSCAKTAEPIKMPFGVWTLVGPMNHVLDGDPDPPRTERCIFGASPSPL